MVEFSVQTSRPSEMVDVTHLLRQTLGASGVADGLVTAFVPHTTAGITINENADPDVVTDLLAFLEGLCPADRPCRHREGNSAAHLKASLMGSSVSVIVVAGKLQLGTWQGVYLCEFDGPRQRKLWVRVG